MIELILYRGIGTLAFWCVGVPAAALWAGWLAGLAALSLREWRKGRRPRP